MATYKNHNYTINRVGGEGKGSRAGQGIYAESSTPKFAIGEKLELGDGRVFRYAYASAAINASLLVSQDSVQLIPSDTNGTFTAASAGATSITVSDSTLGSATKDLYAGAYFGNLTNKESYRIKSNTVAASNIVTFTLYDPIVTAVTSSDDYVITGGLYNGTITATVAGGSYDRVVGVSPFAITSGYYFWLQTAGVAFVLGDAAASIALGDQLQLSDSTAACVQEEDTGVDTIIVGQALQAGGNSAYIHVRLNLGV
tara:strand:+ start:1220 stop:1987 length:768 start_codon:yes stop_codon:yes gene_type:complete